MKQILKIALICSFLFGESSLAYSSEVGANDDPIVLEPRDKDDTSHGPRMPAKKVVYAIVDDNSLYVYSSIVGIFNIRVINTLGDTLVDEYASLTDGYTIDVDENLEGATIIVTINGVDYLATL